MVFSAFFRQNLLWLGAGGLLTFLSSFGQTFFISVFSGEIRDEFGLSHGQWGGIYTLGTSISAIVMIWAGGLTDLFRVRVLGPLILSGLASACLLMAFNPFAACLPVVIFGLRFFGQGMTSHLAVVAMSRWFLARRGRALSIASLGFSIGEACLPVIFVSLMSVMNWHHLWIIAALICLISIPMLMAALRSERTPQSMLQSESSLGMDGRHWTRNQALKHSLFWFMVPALLGPSAFNTAFFFHQVHFAEINGWDHVELVALFPFYTAFGVGSMILSGWLLDRLGTARIIPFFQLPMVVAFAVFGVSESLPVVLLGLFFMAMTTGANTTVPNAFWAEFYGTANIGSIKAMAAAVMVLGSAIGPGVTGVMIDQGIGLETQFLGVSAYFLLTTFCMNIGVRRNKVRLSNA